MRKPVHASAWLFLIFALSIPVKLIASQTLVWGMDYVPVITRGLDFLNGGAFPIYGTLSSKAAFNMPFLVWMQMPVMLFTHDVATILIGTQMIMNLIGTWFTYQTGKLLFDWRAGLAGATLLTFSELGISSSYTAWAQMHLPTFFIITIYLLIRWQQKNQSRFLASAVTIATMAFMTHFSAILLYPTIIVFAFLTRPGWHWRGWIGGVIISLILLAPYLAFETTRDFADIRAFISQSTLIPDDVFDGFNNLKSENTSGQREQTESVQPATPTTPQEHAIEVEQPTRFERAINWMVSIPAKVIDGLRIPFEVTLITLQQHTPTLFTINEILRGLLGLLFFGGIITAAYSVIVRWRQTLVVADTSRMIRLEHRWKALSNILTDSHSGRYLLLFLCLLVTISGLIVTRNSAIAQRSYYAGLWSIQMVMVAYALIRFFDWFQTRAHNIPRAFPRLILIVILVGFAGIGSADRIIRVTQRDTESYSPLAVWLYQPIHEATRWIAEDHSSGNSITISYDIMEENNNLRWIGPWHTVDPLYRIGAPYDVLLKHYYGLENLNTNPLGIAENADYIIAYEPGLKRHDLSSFEIQRFGAIYVLKEN